MGKHLSKQLITIILTLLFFSCQTERNDKEEIIKIEKEFETAVRNKGLAEAFYEFADENAVIKRKNDTLVTGKENIRKYYKKANIANIELTWTPDYVYVSNDGTLAYTYGKFIWQEKKSDGKTLESKGVFHTIWKKQKNGSWKYVWD